MGTVMPTEKDEKEVSYGEWHEYVAKDALVEENRVKRPPLLKEIWPHWRDGVPRKFHRRVLGEAFFKGDNHHKEVSYYVPLELTWNAPRSFSALDKDKHLLPSTGTSEWSGVYRIFCANNPIERCCGRDETGTLYIGMAGAGKKKWSILRDRIKAIVRGNHQALDLWRVNDMVRQKFPWDSMSVEWAFTSDRTNHKGEQIQSAIIAEGFLLGTYNDSYGEYPPWNQRP